MAIICCKAGRVSHLGLDWSDDRKIRGGGNVLEELDGKLDKWQVPLLGFISVTTTL